jgi:hypothetical protein
MSTSKNSVPCVIVSMTLFNVATTQGIVTTSIR